MTRFTCPECGRVHDELPAYAFDAPAIWSAATPEEREADFQHSPDFCQYKDEHFLVRAVLEIPIIDHPDTPLTFGVWATVSQENFWRYKAVFAGENASSVGSMFAWLSNEIPGYEGSLNLKSRIYPQDNRRRPKMTLEPTDHPLAVAQREGIELDAAMRWLHAHGGF